MAPPQPLPHGGVLQGPGFTVRVPADYVVFPAWRAQQPGLLGRVLGQSPLPFATGFGILPPGASLMPVYPGMVNVEAMPPQVVGPLISRIHGLDNPFVAWFNARALQLQSISNVAPARQAQLPAGQAHIREFEATGAPPQNQPLRYTLMVIEGAMTTVQVMIGINLYRWAEFTGTFMSIVSSINLAGGAPLPATVQAVADPDRTDQIEIALLANEERIPLTAMPTVVYGTVIVNNQSIKTGDIHGTGIVVGHHSISAVSQPAN